MSNITQRVEQDCRVGQPCSAIELLIESRKRDLGGFSVRRVLPVARRRMVGPWIFFDHMGPVDFPAGCGVEVQPHPHINLATVTYLFEGEILHRDSLGSVQTIRPGDINLMVAGTGIVHSERERSGVRGTRHRMHGLQLWLALPERDEETDPAFYHYPAADIPQVDVGGVPIRVMMGTAYGATSPVRVYAETLYVEAHLQAGQTVSVPETEESAVYVAAGNLEADGAVIPEYSMAVFGPGPGVVLTAGTQARIAIIGGERLGHRHIEWNFVSSRRARIDQAKQDWKAGRFAKIPGDEDEFIPLPE